MAWLRSLALRALAKFFGSVKLPASFQPIAQAPEKYIVVIESRSLIMQGLLLSVARRAGLCGLEKVGSPSDRFLFNETEASLGRTLHWMTLDDQEALRWVTDNRTERFLCTLNIFQLRGPLRHSPQYRMGPGALAGLLLARRLLVVILGRPFSVPEGPPLRLIRRIRLDFFKNLKIVRGTPFQSMETQRRVVLSGPQFEREIRIVAERCGRPVEEMREMARREFLGIAADPRRPMYAVARVFMKLILKRLFSDVITVGVDRLIPAIRENTVVLVPMHRSHLDYILVGYKLYESNVNPPLVAAGVNLRFWPAGFVIRSLGGYFVKRNARDRLHTVLLRRYLTYLIKRGHLQEFFIEGGRSRSGKMMQPKLGLLNIMVDAYLSGIRKDVLFVPVSITYENLIEDEVFADENTGRPKRKENLLSLIRALDVFRRKYGDVVINFGQPLSLSGFHAKRAKPDQAKAEKANGRAGLVQDFGLVLTRAIRSQINLSLTNLVYTVLLCSPHYGLKRRDLIAQVRALTEFLSVVKTKHGGIGDFTPALRLFLDGREKILNDIVRGGVVCIEKCLDTEVFLIPERTRFTADFYRNSIIHIFVELGILSILQLLNRRLSASAAGEFHRFIEYDLLLPDKPEFQSNVARILNILRSDGFIGKESEGAREIFRDSTNPPFLPAVLQSFFQSLLWVHHNLRCVRACEDDPVGVSGEFIRAYRYDDFLAALKENTQAAAHLGIITRSEALSQASILGALEALAARQIIGFQESAGRRRYILMRTECDEEIRFITSVNSAIAQWQQKNLHHFVPPGARRVVKPGAA